MYIGHAVWVVVAGEESHSTDSAQVMFSHHAIPSLGQFLHDLKDDIESLLAILEASLRNGVSVEALKEAVQFADIDLAAQLEFAKQLRGISPKHYPISDAQIAGAASLL